MTYFINDLDDFQEPSKFSLFQNFEAFEDAVEGNRLNEFLKI